MDILDNAAICKFHHSRIQKFGADSVRALGWETSESQFARFKILVEIGDMSGCSVMDIGCGTGELKAFLDARYSDVKYLGVDQLNVFLDIAISRFAYSRNTTFFLGDFITAILPGTDYVLASGSLNYQNSDTSFIFKVISKLFSTCRIGLAFNLLSKVENPENFLMTYDPQVILTYCKTLNKNAVLIQDYMKHDFTIYMFKPQHLHKYAN